MIGHEPPRSIVITGASSGLGAALATSHAAPNAFLGLIGRDAGRLEAVANTCRKRGAAVETGLLDVADGAPLAEWLLDFDRRCPVRRLIANAGISAGARPDGGLEGAAAATEQVRVNLIGMMNTIEPLLPAMRARRAGVIGIVASIAAYRGSPFSPGYSASKAGARAYGEALRALLRENGISVSVICPGFFESPMGDRYAGPRPFLMPLEKAAAVVKQGLDRGRARIVFPRLLALGMQFADLAPAAFGDALLRRFRFHIRPRTDLQR